MSYRKVDGKRLWSSDTIRSLSDDARMLYVYLLTSPHNNPLCVYRLPEGYAIEDLQWTVERFRDGLGELLDKRLKQPLANGCRTGLVAYDEATKLVAVRGQLVKEGIANPNAVKACLKVLDELPTMSPVYQLTINDCVELAKRPTVKKKKGKQSWEQILEPLVKRLAERLPQPIAEPQEQEQDYIRTPKAPLKAQGAAGLFSEGGEAEKPGKKPEARSEYEGLSGE